MARITEYLKSLIRVDSGDSTKSFLALLSGGMGLMLCLCLIFCLVYDVCTNGYIKTDLDGIGWVIASIGLLMAGGSANKIVETYKKYRKGEQKNGIK